MERGIDGYTFIPEHQGGVLGRGKFSTVYKVTDIEGIEVSLNPSPFGRGEGCLADGFCSTL